MQDIFLNELKKMKEEMDKFYKKFFEEDFLKLPHIRKSFLPIKYKEPLVDIYEQGNNIIAKIDMPGVKKEDISVNIYDKQLEIKAERKSELEKKKKGFYQMERSYTGFYRSVPLPTEVKADQAKAEYKNGILEIKIPKLKVEKKKKAKKVKVM